MLATELGRMEVDGAGVVGTSGAPVTVEMGVPDGVTAGVACTEPGVGATVAVGCDAAAGVVVIVTTGWAGGAATGVPEGATAGGGGGV